MFDTNSRAIYLVRRAFSKFLEMDLDSAHSKIRQSIAKAAAAVVCVCLVISCFAASSPDIHACFHSHGIDKLHGVKHECVEHVETAAEPDCTPANESENERELECLACFLAFAGSAPLGQSVPVGVVARDGWLTSGSVKSDEFLFTLIDAPPLDRGPPVT